MAYRLSMNNIFYTYPQTEFGVTASHFQVDRGVCTCLLGNNGSGKTTIGKMVAGIIKPDRGDIYLGDDNIKLWSLGAIGGQIGYLFQEPSKQIFASTVIEEMTFASRMKGVSHDMTDQKADRLLKRFELENLRNQSTFTLSRGEEQRLALSAMLMEDVSFVVLDEPTTGLDNRRKEILLLILRELLKDKIGILLISHDLNFVQQISEITYFMTKGVLEYRGN